MTGLPYVVSGELELLPQEMIWRDQIDNFRDSLITDLRNMGRTVEWVDANYLRVGMNDLMKSTQLPVVSLDRRYLRDADEYLDISRAVGLDFSDAGYDTRANADPMNDQISRLGSKYAGKEIVLADDVLFSGEMIFTLRSQLESQGVSVPSFMCGIAIGEGEEKLRTFGMEVGSVVTFPDVDDEICERDFTVLPGSGRKIFGSEMSALYFEDQYGRPEQWASIPTEFASDFCLASLIRNRQLVRKDTTLPSFVGYASGTTGDVLRSAIVSRISRSSK
jgi:hypothetical protein